MTLPSLIGQYRILRKIGAGGMGLVYLGEHTLLHRRAAIKTLLPTVAANREIVERFFNEARATSAISDPGVIQIFDFGYHVDGTAYIVMELLEGESLAGRLDRVGKLALGDALRFARQITGSLAAAHAHDIVHRDLKPENIFLVRDAEAQGGERTKIIDFGICKVGAGDPMLTEVGAMIGTPVYMSPEQCRGSGEVDARSDIYAFGCLLFHLLTGRPPFIGEASGELVVAHLEQDPPPPSAFAPELPPAVDALLRCCLAKQPDERFASMTALQAALGAVEVDAEAGAPVAVAPARSVPLGRGFRSVYDANLVAALGKSSVFGPASPVPPALHGRLSFAAPPLPGLMPAPDTLDDEEDIAPRSRAGVRAALACVLVIGVAAGLIMTPLIRSNDDESDRPSGAAPPASLPVETAVATPAAAPSADEPAPMDHAPARTDEAPAPTDDTPGSTDDTPAPADNTPAPTEAAPRSSHATATKPAPRRRVNAEPRTGRPQVSAPRSSGPVRSPAELEPARPARSLPDPEPARPVRSPSELPPTPPTRSSPAPAASPPARPAPPPSTEDLYDTR
ncbi:MAG TPA: protein kinase [Kofleriaceae bacterium]|nr:protein kinase [Kofleriaceae bacterium]